MKTNVPSGRRESVEIVAIGASAGGLEALQEFFKPVPADTGLAFVVIQHLSPDYKSLMAELLARHTSLNIVAVVDGMELAPNTIHLLPPRTELTLSGHKLKLKDVPDRRTLHLPIDTFFISLAKERKSRALAVVLSGTGSDGTLGIRAVKEAGGVAIVQDESTAKFDGMPKSALSTGLVDLVLPPGEMGNALVELLKHPLMKVVQGTKEPDLDQPPLKAVLTVLKERSGVDFTHYKESTVLRRVTRRVTVTREPGLEEYAAVLRESEQEQDVLFREMLIGVTEFFRDPEAYRSLEASLALGLASRPQIRVWCAGCSTGEEAYSLAILLQELLDRAHSRAEVKIFATDVDRRAIEIAGRGFYAESLVAGVDHSLVTRYFDKREGGFQVKEALRRMVIFAPHNLLKDPPLSKLDLISCRNLLIYLKPEIQRAVLGLMTQCLLPSGYLFLGSSETLGDLQDCFETLDARNRIFQRKAAVQLPSSRLLAAGMDRLTTVPTSLSRGREAVLEKLNLKVLSLFVPPAIVVDQNDQILQTINDAGRYLRVQSGLFSNRLYDHLDRDLRLLCSTVLRRLRAGEASVVVQGPSIKVTGHSLDAESTGSSLLVLEPLVETVTGVTPPAGPDSDLVQDRLRELELDLQMTRENLQSTVEELETSNEELQSSNEELIASNEELQSTNEELQSVNEELHSVNSEYQVKIVELTSSKNDEANLLRNLSVGALYLDRHLNIRRITPLVSTATRILESDVGRPIHHLAVIPSFSQFQVELERVLDDLQPRDREIVGVDGQRYLASIRPYRTELAVVDGVLVTFVDVTELARQREEHRRVADRLNEALAFGQMAWWVWDLTTGKVEYDLRKATMAGYTPDELGSTIEQICSYLHPEDYEPTMQAMRDHLEGRTPVWEVDYRIRCKDGHYALYHDRGAVTKRSPEGKPLLLVGTVRFREGNDCHD